MAKKIIVDDQACIGCGMCTSVSDDIFDIEGAIAIVKSGKEHACDEAQEAIDVCPANCIECVEE